MYTRLKAEPSKNTLGAYYADTTEAGFNISCGQGYLDYLLPKYYRNTDRAVSTLSWQTSTFLVLIATIKFHNLLNVYRHPLYPSLYLSLQ